MGPGLASTRSTPSEPDGFDDAADLAFEGLLPRLDAEAERLGCGWWQTDAVELIAALAIVSSSWPQVLGGIAEVLRDGADPDVVVGGSGAAAAFAVAQEWIDAGIEATDVVLWLRAGCWKPTAARAMADAGMRPWQLLDDDGRPLQWVDVPTPDGQQLPLARAVAEEFETVDMALRRLARRAS